MREELCYAARTPPICIDGHVKFVIIEICAYEVRHEE